MPPNFAGGKSHSEVQLVSHSTMTAQDKVILLGCFHQAQPQEADGCYWNIHRVRFVQVLKDLVDTYSIAIIAEEATQNITTSAAVIASDRKIPYTNLDIPLDVQAHLKLRPRAGLDPATARWANFEGKDKYRLAWDQVREFHMYRAFLEFQEAAAQSPSLLVCGVAHQDGLRTLLVPHFEVIEQSFDFPEAEPDPSSA